MKSYRINTPPGRMMLVATIVASGMAFLAGTTVTIALPTIQSSLNATISGIQWVLNGYTLTLAALILVGGSFGDHFGRKRIFLIGIALFTLSSLLSGFATSISVLITFQVFQGIGAALLIPGSLAVIAACIDQGHRGRAIGLWSGFSGGLTALGPFAAGWLVQTFGWASVFFLNVPLGLVAFALAFFFVPETRDEHPRRIDFWGIVLLVTTLLGLSFGLIRGPLAGWSDPFVLLAFVVSIKSFLFFIAVELRTKDPVMPFSLFKNHVLLGANLVTLLLYLALSTMIIFLTVTLQQGYAFTPLAAGLALLPPIILITFLSGPSGALADRYGPRIPMIIGPLVVALGMFLLARVPVAHTLSYSIHLLPGLTLFGLGMALVIAPLTKSALSAPKEFAGVASGINNAASRIASLLAVALMGALLVSAFGNHLDREIAAAALDTSAQTLVLEQKNRLADISIPEHYSTETTNTIVSAVQTSLIHSFRLLMLVSAVLALVSSLLAFVFVRPRKQLLS